mmetsp:Transcript_96984/g.277500  ORF Transcript_96984/g.277500 Transcript_96984/m.277500 type:complete len:664 (-) Transcript_96984:165-2156(-)
MVELVARYLETYQYESALALARTLYAEDEKSEERLHVLANVLIRRHEWKAAREALKGFWSPQNRYLRALCCLHLNLLSEGEEALLTTSPGSKPSVDAVPLEACGFNLLGRICQRANKHAAAVQHFTTSLTLDPLLWASTKALCELGSATVPVADDEGAPADPPSDYSSADRPAPPRPYVATPLSQQGGSPIGLDESLASASLSTVGVAGQLDFGSSSVSLASPNLTPIGGEPHPSSHGSEASDARGGSVVAGQDLASPSPGGAGAGGGRQLLFHSTVSKEGEKPAKLLKGEASLAAGSPLSFSSSGRAPAKWSAAASGGVPPVPRTAAALKQRAVSVLRNVGAAYHYLCQHKCREALGILQELPVRHYNTGWIQHLVGRAYFEMADYRNAKQALQHMQRLDPHRMHGLELLSTALWHLKEEVELCYLAQRVSEFDKYSPEVWCVVGNCFSLQKEHETALKFFQRAIQVDPEFTYAYTLCGHEFVANEDLEKAICMFRNAIQCDSRHYNAWFGIGSIYTKQEKFALAEYHFRRALQINPQSSVLYCHLSLALYENKKFDEALGMLKLAAHLEPRNPQVWFQRATILMSMDKNDEALQELLDVQAHSPKEAQVYFWMGKVCKKLGRIDEALRYFTFALDLDPKDNTQIKNALERLEQADVEEESF